MCSVYPVKILLNSFPGPKLLHRVPEIFHERKEKFKNLFPLLVPELFFGKKIKELGISLYFCLQYFLPIFGKIRREKFSFSTLSFSFLHSGTLCYFFKELSATDQFFFQIWNISLKGITVEK